MSKPSPLSPEWFRRQDACEFRKHADLLAAQGAMIADALEIADESARADITSFCCRSDDLADHWDVESADEFENEITLAARYLDARGLIVRNKDRQNLVRFREGG